MTASTESRGTRLPLAVLFTGCAAFAGMLLSALLLIAMSSPIRAEVMQPDTALAVTDFSARRSSSGARSSSRSSSRGSSRRSVSRSSSSRRSYSARRTVGVRRGQASRNRGVVQNRNRALSRNAAQSRSRAQSHGTAQSRNAIPNQSTRTNATARRTPLARPGAARSRLPLAQGPGNTRHSAAAGPAAEACDWRCKQATPPSSTRSGGSVPTQPSGQRGGGAPAQTGVQHSSRPPTPTRIRYAGRDLTVWKSVPADWVGRDGTRVRYAARGGRLYSISTPVTGEEIENLEGIYYGPGGNTLLDDGIVRKLQIQAQPVSPEIKDDKSRHGPSIEPGDPYYPRGYNIRADKRGR